MKYMGSKDRIARPLLSMILPHRVGGKEQYFVEPFCGGCNLTKHVLGKRLCNDINKPLISLYKALNRGWNPSETTWTRELYNDIRDHPERYTEQEIAFAGICCSYKGKWFGGYAGCIVTAGGKGRNYITEAINGLKRDMIHLMDVEFVSGNYYDMKIPANSIIYCDPPYIGETAYDYLGKERKFDHLKFYKWCHEKVAEGHKVFISELQMPPDFACIWADYQLKHTMSLCKSENAAYEKLYVPAEMKMNQDGLI